MRAQAATMASTWSVEVTLGRVSTRPGGTSAPLAIPATASTSVRSPRSRGRTSSASAASIPVTRVTAAASGRWSSMSSSAAAPQRHGVCCSKASAGT